MKADDTSVGLHAASEPVADDASSLFDHKLKFDLRSRLKSGLASRPWTKLHDLTCGYGRLPDNGHSPMAGRIYRMGAEGGFAAVHNLGATANGDRVVSEAPLLGGGAVEMAIGAEQTPWTDRTAALQIVGRLIVVLMRGTT